MPEPPAESLAWVSGAAKVKRLALPVSLIVGITAVSGAFVAGNDAVCSCLVHCHASLISREDAGILWYIIGEQYFLLI